MESPNSTSGDCLSGDFACTKKASVYEVLLEIDELGGPAVRLASVMMTTD